MPAAIYGDGSDGSQTFSSDTTLSSGEYNYTDLTIEAGVTVTVETWVVIQAQNSIDIQGTLDASGRGAGGGSGASAGTNADAGDGSDADYEAGGDGGAGGADGSGSEPAEGPGSGGAATNTPIPAATQMAVVGAETDVSTDDGWSDLAVGWTHGAGGGGGGGGEGSAGGDGGNGGAGGGGVLLIAPSLTVAGDVLADGADGSDGEDALSGSNDGGGGGGGGGAGGGIWLVADDRTESGTVSAAAGSGGSGGSGSDNGDPGQDGDAGFIHRADVKIAAPQNPSATAASADQVDISWDAVDNPDLAEYRIYRATSAGSTLADYTQVATVGSSTTSYSDTGLDDGTEYHYVVTAIEQEDQE